MTAIEPLRGTPEDEWARWPAPPTWPALDVESLGPVVVLAAHPDDEVLGVGGLVSRLAALGRGSRLVFASDGEASHPNLPGLGHRRREESRRALAALGADPTAATWLALPDGRLGYSEAKIAEGLRAVLRPGDAVLAPWSGDGHPDHEACGRAARAVAAEVLEYPVWTWSWSHPDDGRVPWRRAVRADLGSADVARKSAAVGCFTSQTEPVDGDHPVLPERVLAYFRRPYEVLLR